MQTADRLGLLPAGESGLEEEGLGRALWKGISEKGEGAGQLGG